MSRLENVSAEELRAALADVTDKRAAVRLMVAIAHKNGITQTELAEWYGVERKTVYNWLTRLEAGSDDLVAAVRDDTRPGRPRKLTPDQYERLTGTLERPPAEAGYDALAWTPALVRDHVESAFDREYSLASCRRLLREAGLAYRPPGAFDPDATAAADGFDGGWIGDWS